MKFYCQACNYTIDVEGLATLEEGKCPQCKKIEGFATVPMGTMKAFDKDATMLNDSDFLAPKA